MIDGSAPGGARALWIAFRHSLVMIGFDEWAARAVCVRIGGIGGRAREGAARRRPAATQCAAVGGGGDEAAMGAGGGRGGGRGRGGDGGEGAEPDGPEDGPEVPAAAAGGAGATGARRAASAIPASPAGARRAASAVPTSAGPASAATAARLGAAGEVGRRHTAPVESHTARARRRLLVNAGASKLRQRVTNALVGGGAAIPLGAEGEAGAGVGADAIPRRPSHDPTPRADEPVQEELEAKEADEQAVEEGGGGTAPPPTRTSGAHVLSEVRRGMEAGGRDLASRAATATRFPPHVLARAAVVFAGIVCYIAAIGVGVSGSGGTRDAAWRGLLLAGWGLTGECPRVRRTRVVRAAPCQCARDRRDTPSVALTNLKHAPAPTARFNSTRIKATQSCSFS